MLLLCVTVDLNHQRFLSFALVLFFHHAETSHFLFFFFKGSAAPRDLPSSPTRPSPDLPKAAKKPAAKAKAPAAEKPKAAAKAKEPEKAPEPQGMTFSFEDIASLASATAEAYSLHRSEEHTSELQSPCNLVCRLLLEKKK